MPVYVDDMRAKFGRMIMCHMIGDEAELHSVAQRIGVARKWYQGNHYDICLSKKQDAISLGAIPITMKQCAAMVARFRETGEYGLPEEAITWYHNRRSR